MRQQGHKQGQMGKWLVWEEQCKQCFSDRMFSPLEAHEETDNPDFNGVPDLKRVFNKTQATVFHPNRHYDCVFDLLLWDPIYNLLQDFTPFRLKRRK